MVKSITGNSNLFSSYSGRVEGCTSLRMSGDVVSSAYNVAVGGGTIRRMISRNLASAAQQCPEEAQGESASKDVYGENIECQYCAQKGRDINSQPVEVIFPSAKRTLAERCRELQSAQGRNR